MNFSDGTTLEFDLTKPDDYQQWLDWSLVPDFQKRITGAGIIHNKQFITLPYPKRFHSVKFYANLVYSRKGEKKLLGESLVCHADHIKLSLLVYTYKTSAPVFGRIDMEKVGKQMFPGQEVK